MLNQLISDFDARLRSNELVTASIIIAAIDDLSDDLRAIETWAINNKICTASDWRKAVAREARHRVLREHLGDVPQSAAHFVQLWCDVKNATITGDSQVEIDGDRGREFVDSSRFKRKLRIASDSLDLRLSHASLDDAANEHLDAALVERADLIAASLRYKRSATFDWRKLADATIACDDTITPEFVVANYQHFIWQVKRKQAGLPVDHHLMLILGGAQNVGKSTFAKALFSPVNELTRAASFSQITDDRIIEIWKASVIFMDEMAFASKSDADEVKNVITASTLDRRPMRENTLVKVRQQATMIGTTNQILAQIIRDTTGVRRFSFLPFSAKPCHADINAANWVAAWQSVDENGPSPILPFRAQLEIIQADSRLRSTVEQWIDTIDAGDGFLINQCATVGGVIRRDDLFSKYRHWCSLAEIAPRELLDLQGFTNELKRMAQVSATAMFRPKKGREATGFTYHGPIADKPKGALFMVKP